MVLFIGPAMEVLLVAMLSNWIGSVLLASWLSVCSMKTNVGVVSHHTEPASRTIK
jgi:hypothetical protein